MTYAVIRYRPSRAEGILEMITSHGQEAFDLFKKLSFRQEQEEEKYKGWRVVLETFTPKYDDSPVMTIYDDPVDSMYFLRDG